MTKYYQTDKTVRCMAIPSGVSYEVLLKKFNNGITRKICDLCFECDALHYIICHMCAFRMCKECFVLLIKNDTHIDGIHCPQCRIRIID